MTRQPWTIGRAATMQEAHALMRAHHIRHLPVVDGSRVVGIVTERDLHLMETLQDADPAAMKVAQAMTDQVYTAALEDELDQVVEHMAARKYGSVVIMGPEGIAGIFTAIDGLQALADVLRRLAS